MPSHYLWTWATTHLLPTVKRGDWRTASRMIRVAASNKAYNLLRDLKAGGWYGGYKPPRWKGAHGALSSDYRALDQMLVAFTNKKEPVVDVGSGRGRVLRWLLDHGYERIIGVEIDTDLAFDSMWHFRNESSFQVEIVPGSIIDVLRPEWRQFYAFNPFDIETTVTWLMRLRLLHPEGGVSIIYYNPRLDLEAMEPEYEVHQGVLDCKAGLTNVAILNLRPITALRSHSGTQADDSQAPPAPTESGSTGIPSS